MGWELVGYPSDPIPDDPGTVDTQVQHLRNVASTIQRQVDRLAATAGGVECLKWDSDAAGGFREVVKKLKNDLTLLKARYDGVARALDPFATTLRGCRTEVAAGYAEAQRADGQLAVARNGARAMQDHADQARAAADQANRLAPPGTPAVAPQPWSGPDYNAMLTQAEMALRHAKVRVDRAVHRFRDASRTAATAVDHANHDGLKNAHGIWAGVRRKAHWLAEHAPLEAMSGILSKVSLVFGLLSLIPCLAPICGPIALAAAGLTLLCDAAIQFNKAYEGTFSLGDCLVTIGLDVTCFVAGLGAVRAASSAGRAGETAATAAREASVARDTAKAATSARVGAQVGNGVDRLGARVLAGGPVRRFLLGDAAVRAEARLARSTETLTAARETEQGARSAAAAKDVWADQARADQELAEMKAHDRSVVSNGFSTAGVLKVDHEEHPEASSPAVAFATSVREEVASVATWGHQGQLADAGRRGARLTAQPIP